MKRFYSTLLFLIPGYLAYTQGEAGMDKVICKGGSVKIGSPDKGYCYTWEAAEGLSARHVSEPEVNPGVSTTYNLIVVGQDFSFRRTDEVKVSVVDVDVEVSKIRITICDNVTFSANLNLTDVAIDSYMFEIRTEASQTWYAMTDYSSAIVHTRKMKVAGRFKVRIKVKIDDVECTSKEKDLEVQFPGYNDIISDATMSRAFYKAWQNTLAATTETTRREEGFWIFYNSNTCTYSPGETIIGQPVANEGGVILIGDRPPDNPASPAPLEHAVYVIGFFHTHTPSIYGPARPVGPSGQDDFSNNQNKVAGVVYDYSSEFGSIPAGHPLDSPAELYSSGPDRRFTP